MDPAYLTARLRAELPDEGLPEAFAVITACNRQGKTISSEENAVRNERFRKHLIEQRYGHFPVTGYDPKSAHEEPGFGVLCDKPTACKMGQQLDQQAIFYVFRGTVSLVSCAEDRHETEIGPWSDVAG